MKFEFERVTRGLRITSPAAITAVAAMTILLVGCGGGAATTRSALPGGDPDKTAAQAEATEHPPGFSRDLSPAEFNGYLLSNPGAVVLDMRLPPEWNDDVGHIYGAIQIPVQELEGRIGELPDDRNRPILVYCRSGVRSTQAAQILVRHGYREVVNLRGGLQDYRREGF